MTRLGQNSETCFLCYTGLETDLIFNQNVDLPGFATFPLLESEAGRNRLVKSYQEQIDLAREFGCGTMLESATWMANGDRAAPLGYNREQLASANFAALKLLHQMASKNADVPLRISAQIGPRCDGYRPHMQMDETEAERYHAIQMAQIAQGSPDIVSAFTMSYSEEVIGIVRAAQHHSLPIAISFTLETDGKLPTGMALGEAIERVDAVTNHYTDYFLINCAHPDHFMANLVDAPWIKRLKGVVVNASRCSHEELDAADQLDDGDPQELGEAIGHIKQRFPHFQIFGGCCGTDLRHMREMAQRLS